VQHEMDVKCRLRAPISIDLDAGGSQNLNWCFESEHTLTGIESRFLGGSPALSLVAVPTGLTAVDSRRVLVM
jgi:hypothetical protein